jgi:hypothetical protein
VLLEHRGKIVRHRRIDCLQIDDLIALDDAEPQARIRCEPDEFHGESPVSGLGMTEWGSYSVILMK